MNLRQRVRIVRYKLLFRLFCLIEDIHYRFMRYFQRLEDTEPEYIEWLEKRVVEDE